LAFNLPSDGPIIVKYGTTQFVLIFDVYKKMPAINLRKILWKLMGEGECIIGHLKSK